MIETVEIAVCTWNRAELLKRTLESFSELELPACVATRLIIVDNNSTDETQSVIQSFQQSDFSSQCEIISLKETQQGHTFARNTAVAECTGELLIWTDDDVIVTPQWVSTYLDAANQYPEVSFFGSRIDPVFPQGKPKWIDSNWDAMKGCFAARDLGKETVEFGPKKLPYGANFAIRTSIQKRFAFNESLGRSGHEVTGEDELDLMRRVLAAEHKGLWIPGAVVGHLIPSDRSTEEYVFDYFVGQGRSLVAKGEPWHNDVERLKNEFKRNYFWYKTKRFFTAPKVWTSHMLRAALALGQAEAMDAQTTS